MGTLILIGRLVCYPSVQLCSCRSSLSDLTLMVMEFWGEYGEKSQGDPVAEVIKAEDCGVERL